MKFWIEIARGKLKTRRISEPEIMNGKTGKIRHGN